ncbi:hypothetical protein ACFL23_01965 [Patescibacteria group bacterium]
MKNLITKKNIYFVLFTITEIIIITIPYILGWIDNVPFLSGEEGVGISMFLGIIMIFFLIPGLFLINSGSVFINFIKKSSIGFKLIGISIIIINLMYIAKVYISL